jgi:hypothetical protein
LQFAQVLSFIDHPKSGFAFERNAKGRFIFIYPHPVVFTLDPKYGGVKIPTPTIP